MGHSSSTQGLQSNLILRRELLLDPLALGLLGREPLRAGSSDIRLERFQVVLVPSEVAVLPFAVHPVLRSTTEWPH